MQTKITFIIDNPTNPDEFEKMFKDGGNGLISAIKNVTKTEVSKVWPKEDGSPTPAYRMVDLYFDTYELACEAVKTPESQALFGFIFSIADGGVKILFSEIQ